MAYGNVLIVHTGTAGSGGAELELYDSVRRGSTTCHMRKVAI